MECKRIPEMPKAMPAHEAGIGNASTIADCIPRVAMGLAVSDRNGRVASAASGTILSLESAWNGAEPVTAFPKQTANLRHLERSARVW
jgi:hypothetical protein